MPNTNAVKYVLLAIGSFLLGIWVYRNKKQKQTDENFNKTISQESEGKYFLIFNSVVVLSKQVSKEQYDAFNKQYPNGSNKNVLSDFDSNLNRYTIEDGKYYEEIWDGKSYGKKMLITKGEYDFHTNGSSVVTNVNI